MRILEDWLWTLIAIIGVGGNLLLVYLFSGDFVATADAIIAAVVAYSVGKHTATT